MKRKSQQVRLTASLISEVFSEASVEQYAVSYVRVSSDSQVDNSSLDAQLKECHLAAKRLGVTIVAEFREEGVSGTLVDRPELTRSLVYCAKNKGKIAYFIVKDIDRIARDTLVHSMIRSKLRELGVQVHSINQPSIGEDNPHSRFMENIFSSVAQLEREQIVARTESGRREALLQGAWISPPTYGYETSRTAAGIATLKPHPDRAPAVLKAFELYAEGLEQQGVCDQLNTLGFRTSRNGKFTKQTMSHMLHNITYLGKIRNQLLEGQIIDGVHPAIVSQDLWDRVQARLTGRSPISQKTRHNHHFPLSNVLLCHKCGGPTSGSFSRGKLGKHYGYYHCRKNGCKAKSVPYESIEQQFSELLRRIQPTDDCVMKFEKDFIEVYREKWKQSVQEKSVLQRRLTMLEEKRNTIEDLFVTGKLAEESYRRQLERVEQDITSVCEARDDHVLSEERMTDVMQFCRRFITSIWKTWNDGTVERKRLIQRIVFPVGIRCTDELGLGTPELPPLLNIIASVGGEKSNVVDRVGFEPTTNCLRGNCSTN